MAGTESIIMHPTVGLSNSKALHTSNLFITFADNPTVVGLVINDDATNNREEADSLGASFWPPSDPPHLPETDHTDPPYLLGTDPALTSLTCQGLPPWLSSLAPTIRNVGPSVWCSAVWLVSVTLPTSNLLSCGSLPLNLTSENSEVLLGSSVR